MESDTAFKRFSHEDLFQKHAGVKSNDICPRPEAGPGGSSDESSKQVIKVQCQAAACGATLQVKVPAEYFSGAGDVLVHCGECHKLLKVQLPRTLLTQQHVSPLVPTPAAAAQSTASTVPRRPTAVDRSPYDNFAASTGCFPTANETLQHVQATPNGHCDPASNGTAHGLQDSQQQQQPQHIRTLTDSRSTASGQDAAATLFQKQQAQLTQLNRLAAGGSAASAAAAADTQYAAGNKPQQQQQCLPVGPAPSLQIPDMQYMEQPSSSLPSYQHHQQQHLHHHHSHHYPTSHHDAAVNPHPINHMMIHNAMGPPAARLRQTAAAAANVGSSISLQAGAAGRVASVSMHPPPSPVDPAAVHNAVGRGHMQHNQAAAAAAAAGGRMHPMGSGYSAAHGGGGGAFEVRPAAVPAHPTAVAARFNQLQQMTYQEVLEQATRSTVAAPVGPALNPYRHQALTHSGCLDEYDHPLRHQQQQMLSPTSASVGHRGYHHHHHQQHLPPGCLTENSDMRGVNTLKRKTSDLPVLPPTARPAWQQPVTTQQQQQQQVKRLRPTEGWSAAACDIDSSVRLLPPPPPSAAAAAAAAAQLHPCSVAPQSGLPPHHPPLQLMQQQQGPITTQPAAAAGVTVHAPSLSTSAAAAGNGAVVVTTAGPSASAIAPTAAAAAATAGGGGGGGGCVHVGGVSLMPPPPPVRVNSWGLLPQGRISSSSSDAVNNATYAAGNAPPAAAAANHHAPAPPAHVYTNMSATGNIPAAAVGAAGAGGSDHGRQSNPLTIEDSWHYVSNQQQQQQMPPKQDLAAAAAASDGVGYTADTCAGQPPPPPPAAAAAAAAVESCEQIGSIAVEPSAPSGDYFTQLMKEAIAEDPGGQQQQQDAVDTTAQQTEAAAAAWSPPPGQDDHITAVDENTCEDHGQQVGAATAPAATSGALRPTQQQGDPGLQPEQLATAAAGAAARAVDASPSPCHSNDVITAQVTQQQHTTADAQVPSDHVLAAQREGLAPAAARLVLSGQNADTEAAATATAAAAAMARLSSMSSAAAAAAAAKPGGSQLWAQAPEQVKRRILMQQQQHLHSQHAVGPGFVQPAAAAAAAAAVGGSSVSETAGYRSSSLPPRIPPAAAAAAPVGWGSSIDLTSAAAAATPLAAARAGDDGRLDNLQASLSGPSGVNTAGGSSGSSSEVSAVMIRRHNSAPITTGVTLRQGGTAAAAAAAAVITAGPAAGNTP